MLPNRTAQFVNKRLHLEVKEDSWGQVFYTLTEQTEAGRVFINFSAQELERINEIIENTFMLEQRIFKDDDIPF